MMQNSDGFPEAGIDIVDHTLRVRMEGSENRIDEVIELEARMLIKRDDPYINEDGRRQIDFQVKSWVASGWSETLQQAITYVLAEDVEQPTSRIVAEQDDTDFPATIAFNVNFDARANNRTVFRNHEGRPEGHGYRVIPPNGDRRLSPTLTQFEDTRIALAHPDVGELRFTPLECNDQESSRTLNVTLRG
jgi:hypothetical protein